MSVALRCGAWAARIVPERGGAILALSHAGVPLLAEDRDAVAAPFDRACFPLVPWANRIAGGEWRAGAPPIPPNCDGQPHPLHGVGWLERWHVAAASDAHVEMLFDHAADARWPFDFGGRQRMRLDAHGLTVILAVRNRGATEMPAGLGLHPYFRRRSDTRLSFVASTLLDSDAECIPDGTTLALDRFGAFAGGARLPEKLVDHSYTGWTGTARIVDGLGAIRMRARGASILHLFSPPDGSALCVEPQTHRPDAHHGAPGELRRLAPGASMAIAVRIGVG